MLSLRHAADGPRGTRWVQHELRSKDVVIILEQYDGAFSDEALVLETSATCSAFRFVLGGPFVACEPNRSVDLRPGDALVLPTPAVSPLRSLSKANTVLNIGWRREGLLGPGIPHATTVRPRPLTRARLLALAEALTCGAPAEVTVLAVREALVALRAEGFPFPSVDVIVEACATRRKEDDVARAMELASCSLSSQPMSVDMASLLDVGEYHSLRRIKSFLSEFYFSVRRWRDYLQLRRLQLGAFFMGHPDARTEEVARVLGFRSATSFCHAFHAGGLPSPREVQRRLLAA